MNETLQRCRVSPHLGTWIVVFVVGLCLVVVNLYGYESSFGSGIVRTAYVHGWPLAYLKRSGNIPGEGGSSKNPFVFLRYPRSSRWPGDDAAVHDFSISCLALNILAAVGILGCTAFATHSILAWRDVPSHFSSRCILEATIIAAAVLALNRYGYADWRLLAFVPVCYGIASVFVAVGMGLRRLWMESHRNVH